MGLQGTEMISGSKYHSHNIWNEIKLFWFVIFYVRDINEICYIYVFSLKSFYLQRVKIEPCYLSLEIFVIKNFTFQNFIFMTFAPNSLYSFETSSDQFEPVEFGCYQLVSVFWTNLIHFCQFWSIQNYFEHFYQSRTG